MIDKALRILGTYGDNNMNTSSARVTLPYRKGDHLESSLLEGVSKDGDRLFVKLQGIDIRIPIDVIPEPYRLLVYDALITAYSIEYHKKSINK